MYADRMQVVHPKERSVAEALALSRAVLDVAERQGTAVLAMSVVRGPAVILGEMQRAGRVLDLRACEEAGVSVFRRWTTGTAAWVGGAGLVLALALPNMTWMVADTTARTLLNRNVRLFLRAFSRVGVPAHYFGREWFSLKQRPAGLLGYDVTRKGGVLIEVFVGFEQSIALPPELVTSEERAVDRYSGKAPAGLWEVLPDARLPAFSERLLDGFVEYWVSEKKSEPTALLKMDGAYGGSWVRDPVANELDPCPPGVVPHSLERVPIGYLEIGSSPDLPSSCRWLGGDVLAPRWVYEDVAAGADTAAIGRVPVDGAKVEDLVRVVSTL